MSAPLPLHFAPRLVQLTCAEVGRHLGVDPAELPRPMLGGGRRFRTITRARQLAMWVCRNASTAAGQQMSFPELGRCFNRDHSVVMAGCRATATAMERDGAFEKLATLVLNSVLRELEVPAVSSDVEVPIDRLLLSRIVETLGDEALFPTPRSAVQFALADWLMKRRQP